MSTFKVGDIVECIDFTTDYNSDFNSKYRTHLKPNTPYTVYGFSLHGFFLENDGYEYPFQAFKLYEKKETKIKEGDYIRLVSKRLSSFSSNGNMDIFLGQIVKVTKVLESNIFGTHFEYEEKNNNFIFQLDCIDSIVTEQDYLEFKKTINSINQIYNIAVSIYGEEYCWLKDSRSIVIYFPEINITNSKNHKHKIYDLFVKITIHKDSEKGKLYVSSISGCRSTFLLKELESNYTHSHLSNICTAFSDFCLGSSEFAIIKANCAVDNSYENFTLLFLSLKGYLSWESLEGGPYRHISGISGNGNKISSSVLENYTNEIKNLIPENCFDLNSNELKLINNTYLYNFLNEHFPIKSLSSNDDKKINDLLNHYKSTFSSTNIIFKDKVFQIKIINNYEKDENSRTSIEQSLVDLIYNKINGALTNFNNKKKQDYEYSKITSIIENINSFKSSFNDNYRKIAKTNSVPA